MKLTKIKTQTAGGFSLLELLLVVAVAAVLILAGIAAYTLVTNNQRSLDAKRQMAQIKTTIKNNYTNGNYTSLTTAIAGGMGAFTGMRNATGTTAQTPWGNGVTVLPDPTSNARFMVTFNAVPRSACTDIVNSLLAGGDTDILAAVIGTTRIGTASGDPTGTPPIPATPLNVATISTECGRAATSNIGVIFR